MEITIQDFHIFFFVKGCTIINSGVEGWGSSSCLHAASTKEPVLQPRNKKVQQKRNKLIISPP